MTNSSIKTRANTLVSHDIIAAAKAALGEMAKTTPPPSRRPVSRKEAIQKHLLQELDACLKLGWNEKDLVEALTGAGFHVASATLADYVRGAKADKTSKRVKKTTAAATDTPPTSAKTTPQKAPRRARGKQPEVARSEQTSLQLQPSQGGTVGPIQVDKDIV